MSLLFSMDHRENGSHAGGVYLTQYTFAHEKSKGETRNRHQNHSKRVACNMAGGKVPNKA